MSILKIKDSFGIWQAIRTLKGDKGDHGDPVDVRINGQSILDADTAVAEIPIATNSVKGVLKGDGYNLLINDSGVMYVKNPADGDINNRSTNSPLTLYKLDYAVKASLADSNSRVTWTETEMAAARERIGAGGKFRKIADVTTTETAVLSITKDLDGNDFNLSHVKIIVECPANTPSSANLRAGTSRDGNGYIAQFMFSSDTGSTNKRYSYMDCYLENGYWDAYIATPSANQSIYNGGFCPIGHSMQMQYGGNMKVQKIYSAPAMPAGVHVVVWGF